MKIWLGVHTGDVFQGWRDCLNFLKKQQRSTERKQLREERLRHEDKMAAYEFKMLELSAWNEQWDEFNEV